MNMKAVVSDAGLAAASIATPTGPWISLVRFRLGSEFGFTPNRGDSGVRGTVLYDAPVTTYQTIAPKTIKVVCRVDPAAGPFEFGNMGIMLPGNVLFALAAWPQPQYKSSGLDGNVATTYTFNCYINLEQSTAIFDIDADLDPATDIVWAWSDVLPPNQKANPDVQFTLVKELGPPPVQQSSLLHQSSDSRWTVGTGYDVMVESATIVSINQSQVILEGTPFTRGYLTGLNRSYVIGFQANGRFRSVSNVTQVGSNFRFGLNPNDTPLPPIGSAVTVYRSTSIPPIADIGTARSFTPDPGTSGNFIVPENVYVLYVDGTGAGGGGASAGCGLDSLPSPGRAGGGGGGGGAGEPIQGYVMSVNPGDIIPYSVGLAGAGAPPTPPTNPPNQGQQGGHGQPTIFGPLTLPGGQGGFLGGGQRQAPNYTGAGGAGGNSGGSYGDDGYFGGAGGAGGSGPFGTGGGNGRAATGTPSMNGLDANGRGAGGGGGGALYLEPESGPSGGGGNGSHGLLSVRW